MLRRGAGWGWGGWWKGNCRMRRPVTINIRLYGNCDCELASNFQFVSGNCQEICISAQLPSAVWRTEYTDQDCQMAYLFYCPANGYRYRMASNPKSLYPRRHLTLNFALNLGPWQNGVVRHKICYSTGKGARHDEWRGRRHLRWMWKWGRSPEFNFHVH